jgi:ribose 5-phosphate isomerase A
VVALNSEKEKQLAAEAAAILVEDGMRLGLGTGSTIAYFLPALAGRSLTLRCVATSPGTEQAARNLGISVEPFTMDHLDMAIDGADQIDPNGWLIKGGGAAHTREKLIAASADQFVVIADSTKVVPELHAPVPVELLRFGLESTLERLENVRVRGVPPSPDDGVIADFVGPIGDPSELAARLASTPGVVEHGLFPPRMVTMLLVGRGESVERTDIERH